MTLADRGSILEPGGLRRAHLGTPRPATGSLLRAPGDPPPATPLGRLQGARPADVAADLGFYDQAHFTRHFKRHVAVTPARFARGRARPAGARPVADPRSPAG